MPVSQREGFVIFVKSFKPFYKNVLKISQKQRLLLIFAYNIYL